MEKCNGCLSYVICKNKILSCIIEFLKKHSNKNVISEHIYFRSFLESQVYKCTYIDEFINIRHRKYYKDGQAISGNLYGIYIKDEFDLDTIEVIREKYEL